MLMNILGKKIENSFELLPPLPFMTSLEQSLETRKQLAVLVVDLLSYNFV